MSDPVENSGNSEAEVEVSEKETDWKAEARKWEARAKENLSAAKTNEDAARQLSEIEESKKSEMEKATARAAELEAQLAEAQLSVLRSDVAAAKGVPSNLLTGSTQEELEAAADALIEFRGAKADGPRSSAFKDVSGEAVKGDSGSQFADFFNSRL